MVWAQIALLLTFLLYPGLLVCQAPPTEAPATSKGANPPLPQLETSSGPPSSSGQSSDQAKQPGQSSSVAPGVLSISGKVTAVEGGALSGASVWVAFLTTPEKHLAETRSDARGYFVLPLPSGPEVRQTSGLVVGAEYPDGLAARELLDLTGLPPDAPLPLLLRRAGENYDEPSPSAIDDWLFQRLKPFQRTRQGSRDSPRAFESVLNLYRRRPADWSTLAAVVDCLPRTNEPAARLLAAVALMRAGAWAGAANVLSSLNARDYERDRALLEGIRWNILRRPEEAIRRLQQALGETGESSLAHLELGRASVLAEDWVAALQRLDPALREKRLAPHALYLRAQCLMALGDLEGASHEAKALSQRVKKKRLPPPVRTFVADVLGRLEERSIQPLRSVLTQPIAELQKAVPNLADLDSTSLPPSEGLSGILKQVGANIEKFFRDFASTSALEVIRQARLDSKGRSHSVRMAEMYYVFLQKKSKGQPMLEEYRGTGDGRLLNIGGLDDGFMVTSGFASSLIVFHPFIQPGVDYRFLGRQDLSGRPVYVLGFAQRPQDSHAIGVFRSTHRKGSIPVHVQGLAWISADQFQVLRLRTDLLQPMKEAGLVRETSEIDYRPYHFVTSPKIFTLPSRVTVSIEWGRKRLRNEHIFSRFWLFQVDVESEEVGGGGKSSEVPRSTGGR